MVVPLPNENPPLQFSILRLAIALSVFGIPFAFFAQKGEAGILLSIVVGSALALLALLISRRDRHRVTDLLLFAMIGGIGSALIAPSVTYDDNWRASPGVDLLHWIIAGAAVGCLLGWLWNLATRAN